MPDNEPIPMTKEERQRLEEFFPTIVKLDPNKHIDKVL